MRSSDTRIPSARPPIVATGGGGREDATPSRDGARPPARSSAVGSAPESLARLPKKGGLHTKVNAIWTGKCGDAPVPYKDVPPHRSNVIFALPLNAPRAVPGASAAMLTDMPPARYQTQTQSVLPGVGEIAPTLKPPAAIRTEFDELFTRHPKNRAMALLDWARRAAHNPGYFSDIMRVAVQLSDLLDYERDDAGQGQTHYLDIDDLDNFRQLTQGVASKIARVPDTEALGGIRPEFEGLSVGEMEDVLRRDGLIDDTDKLKEIATYGAKAAMLLGHSPGEALETYGITSFFVTTKEKVVQEFTALLGVPEARAFAESTPKHLLKIFSLADKLAAEDALAANVKPVTEQARADAKIHVTRAMIFGPFLDALRQGTKFEDAAEQCGLDLTRFAAPMLAVAKQARIQDLPKLQIPKKSVAVWRQGDVDKQETTTDYLPHLRDLKQRFQADLSPEVQRKHIQENFTAPAHRPGLRAWTKTCIPLGDTVLVNTEGCQNTMSAVGNEGIASLEAVAHLMTRKVFERNLPGNVALPSDALGAVKETTPELATLHKEALKRFDAIFKNSPASQIRWEIEQCLLGLRQRNTQSSTAEWARIARAWDAASSQRDAYAHVLSVHDVMASAPDAVGDERRQMLKMAYEARAKEVDASTYALSMMDKNRTRGTLTDTGPWFYTEYANEDDETIPNKVQPETDGMEQVIGNLFGVEPGMVKSHLAEHDGSWKGGE